MKISASLIIPLILAIIVYCSNPPWFLWGGNFLYVILFVFMIFCVLYARFKKIPSQFLQALPVFLSSVLFFVIYKGASEFRFSSVVFFITYMCLFFIKDKEKIKAFEILSKSFGVVVGVSLFFWIINNFIFPLPSFSNLNYSDLLGKGEGLSFLNYIVFVQPDLDILRFYSVFDEPGVLGVLAALILYGQAYNFKKTTNILILLGGIFSFSLAFYVVTLVGFFAHLVKQRKFENILVILFSVLGFYGLSSIESFRVVVIDRFLSFGNSVGDRNGILLNQYYDEFWDSNNFLFGVDLDFFAKNPMLIDGQSYKFFIIEYGVVGFLLLLLLYILLFDLKKVNFLSLVLLALFLLSFLQRPFMFTPWQIILFSIMLPKLKNGNRTDEKII